MSITAANIEKNRAHYDSVYRAVDVDRLVERVRDLDAFLPRVTAHDITWHALYLDGFAGRLAGRRVLEVGCGDGLNALVMAALGAEVVANDISSESVRLIETAAARLGLERITTLPGDLNALPLAPEAFDFVVGKAFLHHLTHELEEQYLKKLAGALKADGEARFYEPAVNSQWLDRLRWLMPMPHRPSSLNRRAFQAWRASDPHPERDNSGRHYETLGRRLFHDVEVVPLGSVQRFHRLLKGDAGERYRVFANRLEPRLPMTFRRVAARGQLIRYGTPRRTA